MRAHLGTVWQEATSGRSSSRRGKAVKEVAKEVGKEAVEPEVREREREREARETTGYEPLDSGGGTRGPLPCGYLGSQARL